MQKGILIYTEEMGLNDLKKSYRERKIASVDICLEIRITEKENDYGIKGDLERFFAM